MKHFLIGKRAQLRAAIAGNVATDYDARLFLRWAHGIAKGMEYLASKRIMHGDLAARYEEVMSQLQDICNQMWSIYGQGSGTMTIYGPYYMDLIIEPDSQEKLTKT